jgi:hypothetical protein
MSNLPEVRKSIALANAELGTDFLANLLDGGFIYIYAGTVPDSPEDDVGAAVLLCKLYSNYPTNTLGLGFDSTIANGTLSKDPAETWKGPTLATGDAAFWRWSMGSDDNTSPAGSSDYRLQGLCGHGANFSMNMATTLITSGATFQLDGWGYVLPAG